MIVLAVLTGDACQREESVMLARSIGRDLKSGTKIYVQEQVDKVVLAMPDLAYHDNFPQGKLTNLDDHWDDDLEQSFIIEV